MNLRYLICSLAIISLFIISCLAITGCQDTESKQDAGQSISMTGYIEGENFVTDEGESYLLIGEKGQEALQHKDKQIEVTGTVIQAEEEGGAPAVEVEEYRLLEGE